MHNSVFQTQGDNDTTGVSSKPHFSCSCARCSVPPHGEIPCSSYSIITHFLHPTPHYFLKPLLSILNCISPVVLRQWIDIILLFSLQMLRPHTLSSANTLYYATSRQILTSHHIHIAVAVGTCLLKNTFIGWNCLFPKKNLVLQYNLLYLLKFCLFSKIFATL